MPGKQKGSVLAGCIVLYRPKFQVVDNIKGFLPFLDRLYVIDNSEQPRQELISALYELGEKVAYLPQAKNIGVASALNIAGRLATDDGYDWLLTMDQDSSFTNNTFFQNGLEVAGKDEKIGVVAASYTDLYDRWQSEYSTLYNEIHFMVTSGNMINLKAWGIVGGFEDKLFIDEVDHDYCLKLRACGYKIIVSKEVYMKHVIGHVSQSCLNGHPAERGIKLHDPSRYYYMSRNVLYLSKKYFFKDVAFSISRLYYLVRQLGKIIVLYPRKILYLKYFFAGIRDFFLSKYGALPDKRN
jgi:rhamnosyltransferase